MSRDRLEKGMESEKYKREGLGSNESTDDSIARLHLRDADDDSYGVARLTFFDSDDSYEVARLNLEPQPSTLFYHDVRQQLDDFSLSYIEAIRQIVRHSSWESGSYLFKSIPRAIQQMRSSFRTTVIVNAFPVEIDLIHISDIELVPKFSKLARETLNDGKQVQALNGNQKSILREIAGWDCLTSTKEYRASVKNIYQQFGGNFEALHQQVYSESHLWP